MQSRHRIILAAAFVGLVLGPVLDQIHVRSDTLAYAEPWRFGQAWWVAPQFAVAFALIAVGSLAILERGRSAPPPRSTGAYVAWCVAAFVAAYAVTGIGHAHEWLVVSTLAGVLLLRLAIERPDRRAYVAIAALVLGGTAYEATLSSLPGTFDYAVASLGSVPAWLPLLYAHGGLAVVALLRRAA